METFKRPAHYNSQEHMGSLGNSLLLRETRYSLPHFFIALYNDNDDDDYYYE